MLIEQYISLLQKWNKTYNLTGANTVEEIRLHVQDCLAINDFLHGERIIDVGTGAGLPGIPLAINNPDKQFVLIDSNRKKTTFLNQVKYELGLANVEVVNGRVEAYVPPVCFDSVLTRAFSSLLDMVEKTQHLLCEDGQFLAMKGKFPDKELKDLPQGFGAKVHSLAVSDIEGERCLVILNQTLNK